MLVEVNRAWCLVFLRVLSDIHQQGSFFRCSRRAHAGRRRRDGAEDARRLGPKRVPVRQERDRDRQCQMAAAATETSNTAASAEVVGCARCRQSRSRRSGVRLGGRG
jgi:hypothetical protein